MELVFELIRHYSGNARTPIEVLHEGRPVSAAIRSMSAEPAETMSDELTPSFRYAGPPLAGRASHLTTDLTDGVTRSEGTAL